MIWKFILGVFALLVAVAIGLLWCEFFRADRLTVENRTSVTLTGVSVDFFGDLVEGGDIPPGASFVFIAPNDDEGAPTLRFTRNGEAEEADIGYYTSYPQHYVVTVEDEGLSVDYIVDGCISRLLPVSTPE